MFRGGGGGVFLEVYLKEINICPWRPLMVVVTPINMFGYLLITAEMGDHSSKLLY